MPAGFDNVDLGERHPFAPRPTVSIAKGLIDDRMSGSISGKAVDTCELHEILIALRL